ncbi:polysaccharide biosynthesis/export family protein [Limnospira platensis]|nr:Polysaccharide biosynthesis/export protein [Arthrospira platensis C1]
MTQPSFPANITNAVKSPQATTLMSWGLMSLLIWHSSTPISLAQTQPSIPIPTITPASIRVPDAYTLGPGDLLRVDILDVPEYSGEYLILTDGTLNLPLIGQITVAGLSVSQLTEKISAAYTPFVQQPFPSVRIITPRPISIAVGGEVQRPGTYILPLSTSNTVERQFQFYTVTQLLQ